jgi:uncharacterized membrane protein YgcG
MQGAFRKGELKKGLLAGIATLQRSLPKRTSEPALPEILPRVRLI